MGEWREKLKRQIPGWIWINLWHTLGVPSLERLREVGVKHPWWIKSQGGFKLPLVGEDDRPTIQFWGEPFGGFLSRRCAKKRWHCLTSQIIIALRSGIEVHLFFQVFDPRRVHNVIFQALSDLVPKGPEVLNNDYPGINHCEPVPNHKDKFQCLQTGLRN